MKLETFLKARFSIIFEDVQLFFCIRLATFFLGTYVKTGSKPFKASDENQSINLLSIFFICSTLDKNLSTKIYIFLQIVYWIWPLT